MEQDEFANRTDLQAVLKSAEKLRHEIGKVIIGQGEMIDLLLISILANGHALIEGVPGVAKTLTAKLLSKSMDVSYKRVQFTPDLMPSDVIGTTVYYMHNNSFEFNRGPLFTNILLIDEINRAPAKTQAALFEVMQERQVTVDGNTYPMQPPFLVFATQNPVEHEGVYKLPEAQLDRFLFKIEVGYPSVEEEVKILESHHQRKEADEMDVIEKVFTREMIIQLQKTVMNIHIESPLLGYIGEITTKTRNHPDIYLGASPRASVNVLTASKATAAISGRDFVTPEDIQYVLKPVLRHRIILTPEKEMEGGTIDQLIDSVIRNIEVPR
jgi:MoxR-like ATPase